jgi:serine/threonine protein kinase
MLIVYCFRSTYKKISNESREVIQMMMAIDPVKRISASEGMLLPWINGKLSLEITSHALTDAQVVIRQRLEAREKRHAAHAVQQAK